MNDDQAPATKADILELKQGLQGIQELFRPVYALLAKHSEELKDIRTYIREKLVTRDEFHARMDAFTGRVSDFDYSQAKQRDRLDDHERRISALETKPGDKN